MSIKTSRLEHFLEAFHHLMNVCTMDDLEKYLPLKEDNKYKMFPFGYEFPENLNGERNLTHLKEEFLKNAENNNIDDLRYFYKSKLEHYNSQYKKFNSYSNLKRLLNLRTKDEIKHLILSIEQVLWSLDITTEPYRIFFIEKQYRYRNLGEPIKEKTITTKPSKIKNFFIKIYNAIEAKPTFMGLGIDIKKLFKIKK